MNGIVTLSSIALLCCAPLSAATINVNTTADQVADTGTCSLREAIIAANTNAPSGATPGECPSGSSGQPDTLVLQAETYALTRIGSEGDTDSIAAVGDLDLTQSATIVGAGRDTTTIDAAAIGARAMHLSNSEATYNISALSVRNGNTPGFGGAIFAANATSVVLTDVRMAGNSAQYGGGIDIQSDIPVVSMTRVVIENNEAEWDGGGLYAEFSTTVQMIDSRIRGNQAIHGLADGGGVYLGGGTLTISRCEISENSAGRDGGGLHIGGALNAYDSTIDNNEAGEDGGGIAFRLSDVSLIANSTVSDNLAGSNGGGIDTSLADNISITHSTVASNASPSASAIYVEEVLLRNTIISGTCAGDFVMTNGGNIESPGDNCGLTHATDQIAVTAGALVLDPLAFNGGPTRTRMPSASSVALNTARATYCTPSDQRGTARPQGPACDVGAVERVPGWLFYGGFEEGGLSGWSSHAP